MFKLKLPGTHDDTTREGEPNPIPERVPSPFPADSAHAVSVPRDGAPMGSPLAGTPEPEAAAIMGGAHEGDESEAVTCVHGVRIAHWDSAGDMGHADRVSYFVCESCGATLTPEESQALDPAAPVRAADESPHDDQ